MTIYKPSPSIFPAPATIRKRLVDTVDAATRKLADRCVAALDATTKQTISVPIDMHTPTESVHAVMSSLSDAGYHVTRWKGSQKDPTDEIVISLSEPDPT